MVREIPPCNYVLQKSQRSQSFVTHADKLKPCLGDTPKSWLSSDAVETDEVDAPSGDADGPHESASPARRDVGASEEVVNDDQAGRQQPPTSSPDSEDAPDVVSPRRGFRDRGQLRRPARYVD